MQKKNKGAAGKAGESGSPSTIHTILVEIGRFL